jgi:hypothetical protein
MRGSWRRRSPGNVAIPALKPQGCPGVNVFRQHARVDAIHSEYGTEWPHEALTMRCRGGVYSAAPRRSHDPPEIAPPLDDRNVIGAAGGRICLHRKRVNIATVLTGRKLGVKEVDEGIWLVSFLDYGFDYIDPEQKPDSFSPTRSARRSVRCLRGDP